ncbi:MAG: hypothetical protein GXC73_10665 [Chitinophagaceae bacterium]|nr:hypothetical protein [Chitinophagaceae bacterium]
MNKTNYINQLVAVLFSSTLSGCNVIEGIFKAGMGFGIFIVLAVIALLVFIFVRINRGRK